MVSGTVSSGKYLKIKKTWKTKTKEYLVLVPKYHFGVGWHAKAGYACSTNKYLWMHSAGRYYLKYGVADVEDQVFNFTLGYSILLFTMM